LKFCNMSMRLVNSLMEEKVYWLAWHIILAGQASKFWEIKERFGSLRDAWQAPDKEFGFLSSMQGGKASDFLARRSATDLHEVANCLNNKTHKIIFFTDAAYPEQLRHIFDPPPVLYLRGREDSLHQVSVALVGARKASPYGISVAENLAHDLAAAGVNVVSGMARGIDTAAHRGALAAGGSTVAVLGCGVDVVYPRENGKIMGAIIQSGAVVSEFPPGSQPEAWHFPVRNRVISGLSRVVVVVEAAEKSGALITAHVALEQGRDVMAVPGNITSKTSKGPNALIQQGAAPVLNAADILQELGMGTLFPPSGEKEDGSLKLTAEEKLLHELLDFEPVPLEVLVQKSGLTAGQAMSALTFLEMKGMVRQMPGRLYARAR